MTDEVEPTLLTEEQRAAMKARLRELFEGEPPQEMLDLAKERERQFEQARVSTAQ
ncbi:hypothetical protein [Nonomuraea dietziae]|uniref:hypothetical protein n=1 Tax=Nonomuraea dietziae TaxID=65515 RepID=UPI0033DF5ADC